MYKYGVLCGSGWSLDVDTGSAQKYMIVQCIHSHYTFTSGWEEHWHTYMYIHYQLWSSTHIHVHIHSSVQLDGVISKVKL